MRLSSARIRAFRTTVYAYFAAHGRDLPWRHDVSDYSTFVSEVMLQQTQVPRVAEKFVAWMRRFPTWEKLARASLADVLKKWSGLGYNRRAKFLHAAAQIVVEKCNGQLPREPSALQTLPGIGPATAASIAAFGFDTPTVFIETNIRAVFIHYFFPQRTDVGDDELLPLVAATLDKKAPRKWYSALMDYGTHLKAAHKNPARRSRHHVRQSTFEGSDRQLRGRILKLVLDTPQREAILLALDEPTRVRAILAALTAETLITKRAGVWRAGN